jgi:hypothetical protein
MTSLLYRILCFDSHTYNWQGICLVCGKYNPDLKTEKVNERKISNEPKEGL